MNILAIPASNSRRGLNRQIIGYAARLLSDGLLAEATVEILDLNDFEMPIYSVERQERDGIPERAIEFYDKIGAADAVVISFAEHNGSYSVAWKNVYDWASRHDMRVYQGRKVAMFSTAPGSRGGANVLAQATATVAFFGGELVGSLSIPSFADHFDSGAGEITDPDLRDEFRSILADLA